MRAHANDDMVARAEKRVSRFAGAEVGSFKGSAALRLEDQVAMHEQRGAYPAVGIMPAEVVQFVCKIIERINEAHMAVMVSEYVEEVTARTI